MIETEAGRLRRRPQGQHSVAYMLWGFALWGGATVVFRVAGQWFFKPDEGLLLGLTFLAAVPLIALATLPVYRLHRLESDQRLRAAVLIALPGLLLDAGSLLLFPALFPNLPADASGPFGALLLWAYGLALLSGFTGRQYRRP